MDFHSLYDMLEANQKWLDKLSIFRTSFYWDPRSHTFQTQRRTFRYHFADLLIDFAVVFWIHVCASLVLFWDFIHHPSNYGLIQSCFASGQYFLYICELIVSITFATKRSDLCRCSNELTGFYNSRSFITKKRKKFPKVKQGDITIWVIRNFCKKICLFLFCASIFVPIILYILEADILFLVLKNIASIQADCIRHSIGCTFLRFVFMIIATNQFVSKGSFLLIYVIYYTTVLIKLISLDNPRACKIFCWHVATIIHSTLDKAIATCVSVFLSSCFYGFIIAIALLILLASRDMSTLFCVVYTGAIFIAFMDLHIALYMLAMPADKSDSLLQNMSRELGSASTSSIAKVWRSIKSLRVISFHYGSLGTIKTATRVDYMFSVFTHSINLVLTVGYN